MRGAMIETEAWVLSQAPTPSGGEPNGLRLETFQIPDILETEVLVEPILGCWEGNMSHALDRSPIDICAVRNEPRVILGNSGLVRVLKPGAQVSGFKEGDLCMVFPPDPRRTTHGFMRKCLAFDAPGTYGLLARRTKLSGVQLIRLPEDPTVSLQQWAAFARYVTAWPSWRVAIGALRLMVSEEELERPWVFAWGGGVSLAQVELAQLAGLPTAMIASGSARLGLIESKGITAVDRGQFADLHFDEERYRTDTSFRERYTASENVFLRLVREMTGGEGASIFIEHIGTPVARATLKALGCPGVMATQGWKHGMKTSVVRALECMNWHVHVHTHFARQDDAKAAIQFALTHRWLPDPVPEPYAWSNIPDLAKDYARGLDTYFPLYEVNAI
jgi:NADPH:quinone reductase-like Zn-dependent oxidoreductase